jgi:hypothetical protein
MGTNVPSSLKFLFFSQMIQKHYAKCEVAYLRNFTPVPSLENKLSCINSVDVAFVSTILQ